MLPNGIQQGNEREKSEEKREQKEERGTRSLAKINTIANQLQFARRKALANIWESVWQLRKHTALNYAS